MNLEHGAALALGLLGSVHCLGMCGPLALALPPAGRTRLAYLSGRIFYNSGRIITYAAMGVLFGLAGKVLFMAGLQRALSILAGVVILAGVLAVKVFPAALSPSHVVARALARVKGHWSRLLGQRTLGSMFVIGLLNGLLPCGLVYAALAGAAATGSGLKGALFMTLFGLGTFPAMLAVALAGKMVSLGFRKFLQPLVPASLCLLACLFILRGLNLGIPYISPRLNAAPGERSCCTQPH